jgi:predicted permease
MSDIRYAWRSLSRNPGFSTVAILSLALGLGATTAMFTIFNGVLLRPLGFRDAGRLVVVQERVPRLGHMAPELPVNARHFTDWRAGSYSFEGLGMVGGAYFNLTSDGDPIRVLGARISSSVLPLLGVDPQVGRVFTESEDHPGNDHVVLISDGLWSSRFHRDPHIAGRKILLDDVPYEVIGVLPARPRVPDEPQVISLPISAGAEPQIWKPFAALSQELAPTFGDYNYGCVARLKPGVTIAQATAELDSIQAGIVQRYGGDEPLSISLTPLQEQITGASRQSLALLLTAVGAVLLIVCVNIAALMLINVNARGREIAVRAAIGASASRLLRQILTESLLLATAGGLLGVGVAYALLGLMVRSAPAGIPRLDEVHMDVAMLAFAILLSLVAGSLFGLLPAWRFARADPNDALKGTGRSATEGRHGGRLRNLLVSFEVALSAVTLIAAGLLLNSFVHLMKVDKGFQVENVMSVGISLPDSRYPAMDKRVEFLRALLARVEALPGITAAGVSNMLPLAGEGSNNGVVLEGQSDNLPNKPIVDFRLISSDYLRTIGIPLLQGRVFDEHDRDGNRVLVSAKTAERLWPGANPIGQRFHLGSVQNPLLEVVGVTGDVHGVSLQKDPNLTVYVPYWTRDRRSTALVVRTAMDPLSAVAEIRRQIQQLDSQLAIPEFHTLKQIVNESVASRRFQMNLVLCFGVAALLLAALGVYGVVSYSVGQRTREMGIRMVLGARGQDVRSLVLRQGLAPVVVGLAAGVALALGLGRLLGSFLFGVGAADPATLAGVAIVVIGATAAGCWLPARRATRVDPAVALRCE